MLFLVGSSHGNEEVHVCTKIHFHPSTLSFEV